MSWSTLYVVVNLIFVTIGVGGLHTVKLNKNPSYYYASSKQEPTRIQRIFNLIYYFCLWGRCYYHLLAGKHESVCVRYWGIISRHNHWSSGKFRYIIFIITHSTLLVCMFSWQRKTVSAYGYVLFMNDV